jgi:hypothetical protein
MTYLLSGTLTNTSCKQTLFDIMEMSLGSRVKVILENNTTDLLPGTGFFNRNDVHVLFTIERRPGEKLNYWHILCAGIRGMNPNDRLHYYRTVMQIDQQSVRKECAYGDWNKMKFGYSRAISYGLDYHGKICIYILDYSVATGKGFGAKLTALGVNKRHEEFASYPYLSSRKNLMHNKLLDIDLPKCYFDDSILSNIQFTVYDNACCVEFEGCGIARGSIKEQAYEAILPILINKPKAKVAVNIVASIEATASLLIGEKGGRIINALEQKYINIQNDKDRYQKFLTRGFKGLLQILYDCNMEGFIFKKCGMSDSKGNHLGVVYFVGE